MKSSQCRKRNYFPNNANALGRQKAPLLRVLPPVICGVSLNRIMMPISDINFTTTKIKMLTAGNESGTASGFFFLHNGIKYLATNRHVVIDEDDGFAPDTLKLTLHLDRENLARNCEIQAVLYESGKPLWKQHPSYGANCCDVVLLPLSDSTLKGNNFLKFNSATITFINSEIINTSDVNSFGDVVVIGYPLGFYDKLNNLPVYRRASIASAYGVNFDGLPYFLIDANLHPGTSGSPVVNSHHTLFREGDPKEGYALFGVHSAEHVVGGDPLGLNVVWYAHTLLEIAES